MASTEMVLTGLLLVALLCRCGLTSSDLFFNSKEIHSIQYDVRITSDPVVTGSEENNELADGLAAVTMTNKFGQKYRCLLPEDVKVAEDDVNGSGEAADGVESGEGVDYSSQLTTDRLQKLLSPMKDEPCLIRTKDWWSYEFCYRKEIRQYHMEEGKPSGAIVTLGVFERDYDWAKDEENNENPKIRHHSQFYSNGSICDLTGTMRKTEVRFECEPHEVGDRITRVDEPQSCEYIITITTPKICPVKQLRPEDSPKPKEISCSPMFTQDQYRRYQDHVEMEKILEEKRKKKASAKQKEEMLKLVEGEDISDLDLETEEGMTKLESMVGDKMADKLMSTLNDFLDGDKSAKPKVPEGYEEVELPSGEKKTIPKEKEIEDKPSTYEELLDDVVGLLKKMTSKGGSAENPKNKELFEKLKADVKKSVEPEMEDILEQTAEEMGADLDEKTKAESLQGMTESLKDILAKIDVAEAEIAKVNEEIEKKQKQIDELSDPDKKKEVEVEIKNVPNVHVRGMANSDSELRVVKHLENAIKQKLTNAKLDVGGRTIEVKVITGSPLGIQDGDAEGLEGSEEQKQLQGMIYNMMIGNQDGYNDIEHQMTSEHNYKFDLDALKDASELEDSDEDPSSDETSKEDKSSPDYTDWDSKEEL